MNSKVAQEMELIIVQMKKQVVTSLAKERKNNEVSQPPILNNNFHQLKKVTFNRRMY